MRGNGSFPSAVCLAWYSLSCLVLTNGRKYLFLDIHWPRLKEGIDELRQDGVHPALKLGHFGRLEEVNQCGSCRLTDPGDRVAEQAETDIQHRVAELLLQNPREVGAQPPDAEEEAVAHTRVRVVGGRADEPASQRQ
jgi:hypothetical protein